MLTVIPDSMCWATVLNTVDDDAGSSSHHNAKHSVKSSYLVQRMR